jgi:hypothetical protein
MAIITSKRKGDRITRASEAMTISKSLLDRGILKFDNLSLSILL